MKVDVLNVDGSVSGSLDLDDNVFCLEPRADILHRMVSYQLDKRRSGCHATKGRSDVNGSTKKFVRQKGSGGARHGNRKVAQFRGGAKAFSPVIRSHASKLPKKIRALAMKHALSSKVKEGKLVIMDSIEFSDAKTKVIAGFFTSLGVKSALVIDSVVNDGFSKACNNIKSIDALPYEGMNVYDILKRDNLLLTKDVVVKVMERLS